MKNYTIELKFIVNGDESELYHKGLASYALPSGGIYCR